MTFFSVLIIPDRQLTALILGTVWALIKNTSTLVCLSLSLHLSALLFVSASRFIWPPYLKVDAGSVSEGQAECCVLSVCTLYKLSSISLCPGRTICLLLSVGKDRLNGMGWSPQGVLSPQTTMGIKLACGSWLGLTGWWQGNVMWPWNLIGYYGWLPCCTLTRIYSTSQFQHLLLPSLPPFTFLALYMSVTHFG